CREQLCSAQPEGLKHDFLSRPACVAGSGHPTGAGHYHDLRRTEHDAPKVARPGHAGLVSRAAAMRPGLAAWPADGDLVADRAAPSEGQVGIPSVAPRGAQPWARKLAVAMIVLEMVTFVGDIPHAARVVGPSLVASIDPELIDPGLSPEAAHEQARWITV